MHDQHDIDVIREQLHGLSTEEKIAFWVERRRSESLQKPAVSEPHGPDNADRLRTLFCFIVVIPIFLVGSLVLWFFITSCLAALVWLPIYGLVHWLSGSPIISAIVASTVIFSVFMGAFSVDMMKSSWQSKQWSQQFRDFDSEPYQHWVWEPIVHILKISALVGLWIGAWTVLIIGNYMYGWLSWWPGP